LLCDDQKICQLKQILLDPWIIKADVIIILDSEDDNDINFNNPRIKWNLLEWADFLVIHVGSAACRATLRGHMSHDA
jgi:hypothetical protein